MTKVLRSDHKSKMVIAIVANTKDAQPKNG